MQLQRMLLTVVAITVVFIGFGFSTAYATASELVGALTQKLGVTEQQATGGAGAIFGLAKSKLSPDNFGQVASVVPGMEGLLQAAPTGEATGSMAGAATSAASSMMGKSGESLGGLASLAGPFSQLGMSSDMIGKFVPVVLDYVGGKGGSSVQSLLAGVLK
jgi:Protein of unknown function VcgC/VcgE (DUF2780)